MVMLLTVPSTSTKRRSRNRMRRSDSRSSVRSTPAVVLFAPVSVLGVGHSAMVGRRPLIPFVPGWTGTRVVTGSPRLVFDRLFHRSYPSSLVERRLHGGVIAAFVS